MNKTYSKGEVIFNQGDVVDCMYEIKSGSVGIYANYGENGEKLLTTLTAGATFGEMGLLEKLPRSATAVAAEENTQVQMITEESFADYFGNNPSKALSVMKNMSGRIRSLTSDYLDACRAVAEYEENANTSKKSSWLEKRVKKFLADYAEASEYLSKHPEVTNGIHEYHDYYRL